MNYFSLASLYIISTIYSNDIDTAHLTFQAINLAKLSRMIIPNEHSNKLCNDDWEVYHQIPINQSAELRQIN